MSPDLYRPFLVTDSGQSWSRHGRLSDPSAVLRLAGPRDVELAEQWLAGLWRAVAGRLSGWFEPRTRARTVTFRQVPPWHPHLLITLLCQHPGQRSVAVVEQELESHGQCFESRIRDSRMAS